MARKEAVQRIPIELLPKTEHRSFTVWGYIRGLQTVPRASFPAAMAIEPETKYTAQSISNRVNSLQIYPQQTVFSDPKGTKLYGSDRTTQHNVSLLRTNGWKTNAQQVKQFIGKGYIQFGIVQVHKPDGDQSHVGNKISEIPEEYSIDPQARNFALVWFSRLSQAVHDYPLLTTSAVFRTRDNNHGIAWQEVIANANKQQQLLGESYIPSEHIRNLLNSTGILRLRILEEIAEVSRNEPNVPVTIRSLTQTLDAPNILVEDQVNALEQAGLLTHEMGSLGRYQWEDSNKLPLPQRLPTHVEEYIKQQNISPTHPLPLKEIARGLAAQHPEYYGSYLTKNKQQQEGFDKRIKKYILHPSTEELPTRLARLLRKAKQTYPDNFYTIKQVCTLLAETYPGAYGFYISDTSAKQKYFERQIMDIFQSWQSKDEPENNYIGKQSTTASGHAYVYFTPDQREMNFALVNALRTAEAAQGPTLTSHETIFLPPAEFRQVMKKEHEGITLDDPEKQKQDILSFLFSQAMEPCTADEISVHFTSRIKSVNHTLVLLGELEEAGLVQRRKPIGNRRTRTSTHLFALSADTQEQFTKAVYLQNEILEQIETFIARNSTKQPDKTFADVAGEIPSIDPRKILLQTLNPRYMAQYAGRFLETYTLPPREQLKKLITDITRLLSGRGIVTVHQQKQYLRLENTNSFSWQTRYQNPHIYVFGTPEGDRAIATILQFIGDFAAFDNNVLLDPDITSPIRLYWTGNDAYYFISPIVGREYHVSSSTKSNAPEHLHIALMAVLQKALHDQLEACDLAYIPVSDQERTSLLALDPIILRRITN